MSQMKWMLRVAAVLVAIGVAGCAGETGPAEEPAENALATAGGEHDGAAGEAAEVQAAPSEQGGEESGTALALDATYNQLRGGARLILAYDAEHNAFSGTVANVTDEPLARVRVEVHLSNGTELGPTTPADLGSGESREVTLSASGEFDAWSAHTEVGSEEHDDAEDGEHGDEEEEGDGTPC